MTSRNRAIGLTDAIHYWLATTVLNTVFGNVGSQRVLKVARKRIQESDTNRFPAAEILDDLNGYRAITHLNSEVLEDLLDEIDFQSGSRMKVLLTHLYDDRRAGHNEYEVDHIFPRGKLNDGEYLREQGVEPDCIDWIKTNRDHIANLQLLSGGSGGENQSKSDRDLNNWLERIENGKVDSVSSKQDYYEQHLVPADPELHMYSGYPEFITGEGGRLTRIRVKLEKELPLKEVKGHPQTTPL